MDPIEEILKAKEKDFVVDAYVKKELKKISEDLTNELKSVIESMMRDIRRDLMKEIENIRRAPATVPGKAIPGPTETPYKPWGTLWTPPQYWIKYEDRTSTAVKTAVAKTFVTISANRDAIKFKS